MPNMPLDDSTSKKVREFVTFAERTYLQLAARRLMRLREAAKARGEEWHEFGKPTELECSATVRLSFYAYDDDPRQELIVSPGRLTEEECARLAEEILGGEPVRTTHTGPGLYCWVRKQPA